MLPPNENCAPIKVTDSVLLKCSSRPETQKILVITPKFVRKNCFFADLRQRPLFLVFIPGFLKILAYFERRPFAPSKNCLYPPSHATLAPGLDRSLLDKIRLNEGICFHKEFRALLSISALSSLLLFLTGVGATSKIMHLNKSRF